MATLYSEHCLVELSHFAEGRLALAGWGAITKSTVDYVRTLSSLFSGVGYDNKGH